MSKDWESSHYRICSYVILKDINTNKEFVVFNTHLDHRSEEARIKGIQLIIKKIQEFGNIPTILMGDLNAKPNSTTLKETYKTFDDASTVSIVNLQAGLSDITYQNFGSTYNKRVDYFLVSKNSFKIKTYDVLDKTYNGEYASDHYSLYIDIEIK